MSVTARTYPTSTTPKPPFRADHVGSLLRPVELQDARAKAAQGLITAAQLQRTEDEAIADAVAFQRSVGLQVITDGEYRRAYFHLDFLKQIDGVETYFDQNATHFRTAEGKVLELSPPKLRIAGKLRRGHAIMLRDYQVLAAEIGSNAVPKITIPSPSMAHFRGGRQAIDATAYPEIDDFFADLASIYREEIAELAAAGCRYLQMDDTNLAYLCDDKMRENARRMGEDPDKLPELYAWLINQSLATAPDDMFKAIHLCRGNFRSAFVAEGGYDRVADVMFNQVAVDAFFLEFDDERSGTFEPLRYLPKGKYVVLGLISSKLPALETKDEIKRRVDEAARIVPLDQLCLSPQCGFSSTEHGNDITVDDQRRKLELVVECAREIWG
jgi:5-methyltetrahydropteroyltriglutamate--homocysteine methyltransferase